MVVSVRNLFVPTVSHTKLMHTKLRRTQSLAEVPYYVSAAIFCLTQILTYLLIYLLTYLITYLLNYLLGYNSSSAGQNKTDIKG